jgi:gluconokinase
MLELPPNTEAELAKMEPTTHGLTVLPFIAGERAPGWHDHAQATITGLTLHSQPIDLLRAGLESVAYRFALIHQSIAPQLPEDHQIIASGSGLLSSPAWMQIMADVLNRPLIASAEREATSRGVALLALEALGITENRSAATEETYYPNAEHHALHQAARQKQVELYNRLIVNPF